MEKCLSARKADGLDGVSPKRIEAALRKLGILKAAERFQDNWARVGNGTSFSTKNADEMDSVSPKKIMAAMQKDAIVAGAEAYVGGYARYGLGSQDEAFERYASMLKVSGRTICGWCVNLRKSGLVGLVDNRGGIASGRMRWSMDAFEYFESLWVGSRKLTFRQCWGLTVCYGWSEHPDWEIPSYGAQAKERMGTDN